MDYLKLQNGSDIRGIASEGIEGQHINITEQAASDIGAAFVLWLKKALGKNALRIGIGRDSRISGPALLKSISEAMAKTGATVYDLGLMSTPAMFMTTVTEGFMYDGAVMITASHLPFNRNGFKFFTKDGGLEHEDITEILHVAEEIREGAKDITEPDSGKVITSEFMSVYSRILSDKIRKETGEEKPLTGLHIIVDAGNGAGGFFVNGVLSSLGADTKGSQFLNPDGTFPNHIPNPEDKTAMESITKAVLKEKADLGIIFDTDVDRAGAVLPDGKELNRNRLIAVFAKILLREHPGTTIVTDSVTSAGLREFIEKNGGIHHRFKRGYRNVINESIRLNNLGVDSLLAMETSGHGALKENWFLDDGAYLMTRLVIEMARGRKQGYNLSDLVKDLKEPAEAKEFRMNITTEDFRSYGEEVLSKLNEYAKEKKEWIPADDNHEGLRFSIGDGWFLLRLSLHDPLMPLNIEGESIGSVKRIAGELYPFLKTLENLDTRTIGDFLKQHG